MTPQEALKELTDLGMSPANAMQALEVARRDGEYWAEAPGALVHIGQDLTITAELVE